MMRVVVADKMSDAGLDVLRGAEGIELDNRAGISAEDLVTALDGASGLLVRSRTTVTAEMIEKSPSLKVIGRAGIGVDNIDCQAATEAKVVVMNAPSGNALTTAEHTIAMMFALARQISEADASMKQGKWEKKRFMGVEIQDKVAVVIGAGNIGGIVVKKMVALGMDVRVVDPVLSDEAVVALGAKPAKLDDVIEDADFLSVHVPRTPQTKDMIGNEMFDRAKEGLRLLNVARGGIIDETALLKAIETGKVAGAGLDVFTEEPPESEVLKQLIARPEVVATPHLGASTYEAQIKVAQAISEQVRDFLLGGEARNVVNPESLGG